MDKIRGFLKNKPASSKKIVIGSVDAGGTVSAKGEVSCYTDDYPDREEPPGYTVLPIRERKDTILLSILLC